MQLTDVGLVRSRLTLPDDEGINKVINDALDAAAISIEAALQSVFDRDSYQDTYRIDTAVYGAYSGLYRLKLSHGFAVATTLIVEVCDDVFVASPDWVQLAAHEFLLSHAEKGFIDIPDTENVRDRWVRATYEAGFTDLEEVPPWLQEASFSIAVQMMSVQQIGSDNPVLSKVYAMLKQNSSNILDRHMRTSSRAIPPTMTA